MRFFYPIKHEKNWLFELANYNLKRLRLERDLNLPIVNVGKKHKKERLGIDFTSLPKSHRVFG